MATLATQWREIGRKWTLFGVGVQLSVAWVAAVAVFQVGEVALMSAGPLRVVLGRAGRVADQQRDPPGTGLSMDAIRTSLDQLVRMGYLSAEAMATAYPPSGCGSCGSASAQTGTCSTGPVLLGLSLTRRAS